MSPRVTLSNVFPVDHDHEPTAEYVAMHVNNSLTILKNRKNKRNKMFEQKFCWGLH